MVEHLTEAQAKAFRIADNRLCEIGAWDEELLGQELRALSSMDIDFDLDVVGFDSPQIDSMVENLTASTDADDPADSVQDTETEYCISKIGDLWKLGEHLVLNGNTLDRSSFQTLLGEQLADAVFSDPPYNLKIDGNVSGLGRVRHGDFPMASGEMSCEEYTSFLTTTFSLQAEFSRDGAVHYQCMDWRHLEEISIVRSRGLR